MARKKSGAKFELEDIIQLSAVDDGGNVICPSDNKSVEVPVSCGKAKRKNPEPFCKTLEKILPLKVAEETVSQAVFLSPLGKNISYQEAILLAQVIKAANGDTQAASFIRDSSGNKQKEDAGKERCVKFEDL